MNLYGFHKFKWGLFWRGSVLRASFRLSGFVTMLCAMCVFALGVTVLLTRGDLQSWRKSLDSELWGHSLFFWGEISIYGAVIAAGILTFTLMTCLYAINTPRSLYGVLSFSLLMVPLSAVFLMLFGLAAFVMCHHVGTVASWPATYLSTPGMLFTSSVIGMLTFPLALTNTLSSTYWRSHIAKHGTSDLF